MYNIGDFCVIESKTSCNNGKLVKIVSYCNGNYTDIVRVNLVGTDKIIQIKDTSLRIATVYDKIRNLSDEDLHKVLRRNLRKKIKKEY